MPAFFLVTFALKTPLALVGLLLLAAALAPRLSWRQAAFLWLPVLAYLAFTFTRGLQIGHRHLLPICAGRQLFRLALATCRHSQ